MCIRDSSDADPLSVAEDPDSTRFIGEIAGTWGTRFSQVQSVGLVTNLKETGSDPPADELRTRLINEMKINKVMNPNEILADPSTSLVVVRGWLPPGIQKGDSYDIEVVVPPRSKTASLRDGTLMPTQLRRTERRGGELHQGHVSSSAAGAILVDSIFSEESDSNESRGRILGGGVAVQSRPIGLYVRDESGSVSASLLVASAINRRFDTFKDGSKTGVATPKDNRIIELLVPRAYRLNIGRYLAVIRNLPFRESNGSRQVLMTQLESELREPVVAEQAAKKLEALGEAAVPILLRGLTLDNSEIRFYAAESLAYMGEVQAASVLGEIAATSPAFRWHAITALASMDDVEAGVALSNLLHHPNIETRYGSFRAMFARSPQDPTIAGKRLSSFYLHSVVSDSEPFVHFSRVRRPEIVVFGHDQRVRSGFLYVGQGLTVKAIGEGQLDITLYGASGGDQKVVCSDRISDLIETRLKHFPGWESRTEKCWPCSERLSGRGNCRAKLPCMPSRIPSVDTTASRPRGRKRPCIKVPYPTSSMIRSGNASGRPPLGQALVKPISRWWMGKRRCPSCSRWAIFSKSRNARIDPCEIESNLVT